MALFHTLRSGAEYMSAYVQLPVFVASLRQKKNADLYISTEQDTSLQRIFLCCCEKKGSLWACYHVVSVRYEKFFYPFAAVLYGHEQ